MGYKDESKKKKVWRGGNTGCGPPWKQGVWFPRGGTSLEGARCRGGQQLLSRVEKWSDWPGLNSGGWGPYKEQ